MILSIELSTTSKVNLSRGPKLILTLGRILSLLHAVAYLIKQAGRLGAIPLESHEDHGTLSNPR